MQLGRNAQHKPTRIRPLRLVAALATPILVVGKFCPHQWRVFNAAPSRFFTPSPNQTSCSLVRGLLARSPTAAIAATRKLAAGRIDLLHQTKGRQEEPKIATRRHSGDDQLKNSDDSSKKAAAVFQRIWRR
jgi:hypothetical protein